MENLTQYMHNYNCDECYRGQEQGGGRSHEKKDAQRGPSEEVMVKMRRNTEEALEGATTLPCHLCGLRTSTISLISWQDLCLLFVNICVECG